MLTGGGLAILGAAGGGYELVRRGVLPGRLQLASILGACGGDPGEPAVLAGQVTPVLFWSRFRRRTVRMITMRPPGAGGALPVVLALHGLGGDAGTAVSLGYPRYLAAAVRGGARPFAVVSVDGGAGYWHRHADGDDPAGMLFGEVLPRLRAEGYRTGRIGLSGWSMGGYGALVQAARQGPARIAAVTASSPAIFASYRDAVDADPASFAGPADFAANDPRSSSLVRVLHRFPVRIDCGSDDPFAAQAAGLRRQLGEPPGGIWGGCHDTAFWRRMLPAQLAFLARHLGLPGSFPCGHLPSLRYARLRGQKPRIGAAMRATRRLYTAVAVTAVFAAGAIGTATIASAGASTGSGHRDSDTSTPIKHLVVIFDENVSFDHYFGTYPYAANLPGENQFRKQGRTRNVDGLYSSVSRGVPTGPLLTANPNLSNPQRLRPADPMTCDQDHGYTHEQSAADNGKMDLFVQNTGRQATIAQCLAPFTVNGSPEPVPAGTAPDYAVMDYYDGNTITGLWNYAQHFAMSDNAYVTTYGPSTPGAMNVMAAQTYGTICGPSSAAFSSVPCQAPAGLNLTDVASSNITTSADGPTPVSQQPAAGTGTTYSDADPTYDICSYLPRADGGDGGAPAGTITMGGNNIGEELTSSNLTWGWFQGGFDDGYVPAPGTTPPTTAQVCSSAHKNVGGNTVVDYSPHHEPFQYYASTANPMHLPPTSVGMIGHNDQANHQYDIADFFAAADTGNLPAVSYLKAPAYQDAHAGYSDPADEQQWLVSTINHLEKLPSWRSTAVVITYDDSDGWYDHVFSPVRTASQTSLDTLNGAGQCGAAGAVPVNSDGQPEQARCGLGVRLPFLVVSPFAKTDYVDHTAISQASVVRFIEDNWGLSPLGNGAVDTSSGSITSMLTGFPDNDALFLNPTTGELGHQS